MKRVLGIVLVLAATPLFAINTSVLRRGDRVGVLRMSEDFELRSERVVSSAIYSGLSRELRARGFDAFESRLTYDDLRRGDDGGAAYYVEIVSARAANRNVGEVGVGADNAYATIGIVTSRVAAEVRLYDGKTLELVDSWDLWRKSTAVQPTSIGVGTRALFAAIALPFLERGRYTAAANAIAGDAAERIARTAAP